MSRFFFLLFFATLFLSSAPQAFAQFGGMGAQRASDRAAMMNYLAYLSAKAEGRNVKAWWKGESTIGLAFTQPLAFKQRTRFTAGPQFGTDYDFDSTITGTARPVTSWNFNGNSNSLLARLGSASIVSFSWGVNGDWLRWTMPRYNSIEKKTVDADLNVMRVGVPLTLDYKWGADVDWDRSLRGCFAVGGGIMPAMSFSYLSFEDGQTKFTCPPYLYASAGFFAGMMWKVRASYTPGVVDVYNGSVTNSGGTITTMNITGRNVFTIGLATNSFSYDWGHANGYRTGRGGGGGGRSRRKPGRGRGSFDGGNLRMF